MEEFVLQRRKAAARFTVSVAVLVHKEACSMLASCCSLPPFYSRWADKTAADGSSSEISLKQKLGVSVVLTDTVKNNETDWNHSHMYHFYMTLMLTSEQFSPASRHTVNFLLVSVVTTEGTLSARSVPDLDVTRLDLDTDCIFRTHRAVRVRSSNRDELDAVNTSTVLSPEAELWVSVSVLQAVVPTTSCLTHTPTSPLCVCVNSKHSDHLYTFILFTVPADSPAVKALPVDISRDCDETWRSHQLWVEPGSCYMLLFKVTHLDQLKPLWLWTGAAVWQETRWNWDVGFMFTPAGSPKFWPVKVFFITNQVKY